MLTTRERPLPPSTTVDGGVWRDPPSRRLWAITGIVVSIGLLIPLLTSGLLLWSILYAPLSDSLPEPRDRVVSEITHVYDRNGEQIAVLRSFDTNIPVNRDDIPQLLKNAVIATEDSRFYSHKGVDLKAVARAAWADIQGGGYIQGASTITQQYVRQLYTGSQRTLDRKVREVVLAGRLEKKLGKEEILYRYLSDVYLGSGAYGVGAAAQTYFRKPVQDLTVSEAALLAGLIQSPSADEPRSNPQAAEQRRQLVLKQMLDQGHIDNRAYAEATPQRVYVVSESRPPPGRPATLIQPPESQEALYPYYVDYVRRYLIARYGSDKVYRGGLKVETALDPALQAKAEASVKATLEGTAPPLEMSLVAMEPQTGLVEAVVGGRDFATSQVNLALGNCANVAQAEPDEPVCIDGGGTGRQPGSAFKPITLAAAYEKGLEPGRSYRGPSTLRLPNCSGAQCTVRNAEGGGYGALDLPRATAYSVNTIFAQLVRDVGIKETAEMAHRLGLTMVDPEGRNPADGNRSYGHALTLGSAETSPVEMASAFSVFAARGMQFPASPVVKVTDSKGKVLEDNTKRKGRRVLDEGIADHVTEALKGTIQFGTGRAADIGRPNGSAGKTGTSENYGNAWFVGYTPTLTTAVWMGYSDSSEKPLTNVKGVGRVYGGTWPARTWQAFMTQAMEGTPPIDFPPPSPMRSRATTTRPPAPVTTLDAPPPPPADDFSTTPPPSTSPSGNATTPDTIVPPLDLAPDEAPQGIPPPLSVPPYTGPRPTLPSEAQNVTSPYGR
ncbi:MAG: penicillin-binding protein [Actinomycetota bacterium]|nr:penicillin-binding protein [Actinomycetota bacterium]